jgi:hypothetical protein
LYFVFGNELPSINMQATPSQIQEWKEKPEVGRCFYKLFRRVSLNEPTTYMTKVIDKLWKEKRNAPKIQVAFAISICETYLDPDNQTIQISEQIKPKIHKNMVNYY